MSYNCWLAFYYLTSQCISPPTRRLKPSKETISMRTQNYKPLSANINTWCVPCCMYAFRSPEVAYVTWSFNMLIPTQSQ